MEIGFQNFNRTAGERRSYDAGRQVWRAGPAFFARLPAMPFALPEDGDAPSHGQRLSTQGPQAAPRCIRHHRDQHTMRAIGGRKLIGRSICDLDHQFGQCGQVRAKVFAQSNFVVDLYLLSGKANCLELFGEARHPARY
jgi:hypothetical protein